MTRKPGCLIVKDPDSDEPWSFNWAPYMVPLSATPGTTWISTSTWTYSGVDESLFLHDDTTSVGSGAHPVIAEVFMSGGTPGVKYKVTNRIVTNNEPPVTDERSIDVLVEQR